MQLRFGESIDLDTLFKMVRVISKSAEDYVYVWDIKNNYWEITESFLEKFPLKSACSNNVMEDFSKIAYPDDVDMLVADLNRFLESETNFHNLEYRIFDKHLNPVWIKCQGEGIIDENGEKIAMIGVITNMTKENKFDYKTGLMVKKHFQEKLSFIVEKNQNGIVMIFGIDYFKDINDKYGQNVGDEILAKISEYIKYNLSDDEILYRLDGDKFGILLVDKDIEYAKSLYNNIKSSIRNIEIENCAHLFYTISCGISQFPLDSHEYTDIYTYAENALYMAKRNGRNQYCIFTKSIIDEAINNINVQEILSKSINNDFYGFKLLFQPQVELETEKIIGAEVLLRWEDNDYGRMMPNEFIPILEKTLLMIPVGRWIIRESLKMLIECQKYYSDFQMSVNLSFVQFKDNGLDEYIYKSLDDYNIDPRYFVLELTENIWVPDLTYLNKKFEEFRDKNIKIAIDDFGTGYSSLSYLKEIPMDIIKIDRCFVNKMTDSNFDYNFIKFIIELSHGIDKKVCVEGVETEAEIEKLRLLKPDYIQGFYYYRPLPQEDILNLLIEQQKEME